jgi:hypothetical protein
MDELRVTLAPLTDWIGPEFRSWLPVEAWWLVLLVVLLAALVVVGYLLRAVLRGLVRGRRGGDWDRGLRQDLEKCSLANGPPTACVYHVPVRLRLVVVAPGGTGIVVEEGTVTRLLERAVPGLGALVARDGPRVCIWPAQLSTTGFTNSFHRCTPTGRREDEPSEWVLLAGRAQGGRAGAVHRAGPVVGGADHAGPKEPGASPVAGRAAAGRREADMKETGTTPCGLCGRAFARDRLTRHHCLPKQKGGTAEDVELLCG